MTRVVGLAWSSHSMCLVHSSNCGYSRYYHHAPEVLRTPPSATPVPEAAQVPLSWHLTDPTISGLLLRRP